jgi:hypothetical protein
LRNDGLTAKPGTDNYGNNKTIKQKIHIYDIIGNHYSKGKKLVKDTPGFIFISKSTTERLGNKLFEIRQGKYDVDSEGYIILKLKEKKNHANRHP